MKPGQPGTDRVDKERYEARRGEVLLHMSHFFVGYLTEVYRDPVLERGVGHQVDAPHYPFRVIRSLRWFSVPHSLGTPLAVNGPSRSHRKDDLRVSTAE